MYINGIQCDVCCKVHSMNIHHDPLPEGWFSSAKGDELEKKHFCSLHCLHEWVEKQMPVVEEVKPDRLLFQNEVKVVRAEIIKKESDEYWRDL